MKNRRDFLRNTFGFGAGLAAAPRLFATGQQRRVTMDMSPHTTGRRIVDEIASVQTPDIPQLPWRMDGKVKEFHLIAEPVKQEIVPGRVVDLWGYNGSAPGLTIQINQRDRVRIIVDNHLPEATSMHWHGFEIPNEMDGAPGSSQDPIPPGGRFVYDFTLHQEGTYFYHSHMAMQEMMGMIGAFIMHPREPHHPRVDKDFAVIMQEYAILPNNSVPNHEHGIQLAHLEWKVRAGDYSADRPARGARSNSFDQSRHGPPPYPSAWAYFCGDRQRRRPPASIHLGTGQHGAGRRSPVTRHRVRGQ